MTKPLGQWICALAVGCSAACGTSQGDGRESLGGTDPSPAGGEAGLEPPSQEPTGDDVVISDDISVGNPPPDPQQCASTTVTAQNAHLPIDIIVVIDTSLSMTEEIDAVERNINENFAAIIQASGVDYRVVLFGAYGTDNNPVFHPASKVQELLVCIEAPLGPEGCATRSSSATPHNPDRFFHFYQGVNSDLAWCVMQSTANAPPRNYVLAPSAPSTDPLLQQGWLSLLRPDAHKVFIVIGDDGKWALSCPEYTGPNPPFGGTKEQLWAKRFDQWLLRVAPEHFGTAQERRYTWHSIVGIGAKGQEAYEPSEPVDYDFSLRCPSASTPGLAYQELSVTTGGLRYPVCSHESYDAVFRRFADGIVKQSALPCEFKIPTPPTGAQFDPNLVNVTYSPSGSMPEKLESVPNQAACGALDGWYYNDAAAPTAILACPQTCGRLSADQSGSVDVELGCATRIRVPK